ncbi:hypothetical protein V8C86DRAFT_3137761 [Haematococcus lacustris]
MGLNRDTSQGSYRASAAAEKTRSKLKEKVPGSNIFDDITSFLFDLGMDFLTVNGQSVGVLGLRARDVPRHVQGRDACIAMLAIFLKSEPAKYVHGFMDQPLRDIKGAIYNKISITINKIEHVFVAIFTTFMADLPARMKLTRCLGHSSGCPCMACTWYTPGQHPKHKGYNVQQEIEWTDPVTFITAIYTGHPHQDHMQLTDEQYDARGLLAQQEVEAALAAARAANKPLKDSSIVYSAACRGARGVCVITQHLDYASSLDAFVTPTYHTFCLGVLRDFIEYLLSTASSLSTQAKTTIRERQAALHIPTDYGRKPTCCIDDRFNGPNLLFPTPSPAQPSPAQPSPAQPSPAQPSPAQPSPAQPSPAQPSPAQPSPAQPSPAQPSPAQPSPAQPSPAQPSPAQPSPAQPSPAQPSPAQPSPAQPSPAQPSPAQPSPAQPSPAQPSPAQPSPAQPSPAQPSPAQPSPAQPSPALPPPPPPPSSPYHKKQVHGAQEQPGAAAMEALPGRYRSGASNK